MGDLLLTSSAMVSDCGVFRHRLDRDVQSEGIVILYCGVNPSTADAELEDQTTKKWRGFTIRNGGRKYIAVNVFDMRATDVTELSRHPHPISPDNPLYVQEAIAEADVLVPCWGNRAKIKNRVLHQHLDAMRDLFLGSGKPVKVFGLTKSGDPKHPQMLGYDTPLIDWADQ